VRSFQQALTVGYQVARLAPFRRWALDEAAGPTVEGA
jgi:hypothetical protein